MKLHNKRIQTFDDRLCDIAKDNANITLNRCFSNSSYVYTYCNRYDKNVTTKEKCIVSCCESLVGYILGDNEIEYVLCKEV